MKDSITDLLDVIGLLLFAAGIAYLTYRVFPWLEWSVLFVAGVIILGGSFLSIRLGGKGSDE